MKTAEQWWDKWREDGEIPIASIIEQAQQEAYHEGQLAGLQLGKETIEEVFSKTAEKSESV